MSKDNDEGMYIGLQIGGSLRPQDKVGMHVAMPKIPGVGVDVDVNRIDSLAQEVIDNLPDGHVDTDEVKKLAESVIEDCDMNSKIDKVNKLVSIGAGISQIGGTLYSLSNVIGH